MAWYLVFHIVGLVVWMGALLDLTRILGYHVKEEFNVQQRLSAIEFRIFFFVATPGLVITAIFGILLFFAGGGFANYFGSQGWFHAKLTLVIFLFAVHVLMGRNILKLKAQPQNLKPTRYKILHGTAALALVLIVILVFIKPF